MDPPEDSGPSEAALYLQRCVRDRNKHDAELLRNFNATTAYLQAKNAELRKEKDHILQERDQLRTANIELGEARNRLKEANDRLEAQLDQATQSNTHLKAHGPLIPTSADSDLDTSHVDFENIALKAHNAQLEKHLQREQARYSDERTWRLKLNSKLHEFRPMTTIGRLRPRLPNDGSCPYIEHDAAHPGRVVIKTVDSRGGRTPEKFCDFDKVYGEGATNKSLWDEDVGPFVDEVLNGHRVTVFVYGASNSGKTFTMRGVEKTEGMIQLAISHLVKNTPAETTVSASMVEVISNNTLNWDESEKKWVNAKMKPTPLTLDRDAIYDFFKAADRLRTTRDMTKLKGDVQGSNSASSRGHTVFALRIGDGQLAFVDLAGSEHLPDDKDARGESIGIKRELSSIFNVLWRQRLTWQGKDVRRLGSHEKLTGTTWNQDHTQVCPTIFTCPTLLMYPLSSFPMCFGLCLR